MNVNLSSFLANFQFRAEVKKVTSRAENPSARLGLFANNLQYIFLPHRAKCMKKKLSTEASTSEIAHCRSFFISVFDHDSRLPLQILQQPQAEKLELALEATLSGHAVLYQSAATTTGTPF